MGIEYKILKDYGVVANHNGIELRLRLISWDNNPSKFDLRAWKGDYAMGGITMTKDEIETLGIYINEQNLFCTKDDIKTEVVADNPVKKRGRPAKTNASDKVDEKKDKDKKKTNVIEFPKPKEEIIKLVTEGSATYAECIEKIEGFKKIYVDSDSQYVLDGILELCKVDKDFRNNVMRDDKDFEGALDYMADMCKKGYGYKKGNYGFMDRDMGLGFTIDYFNLKPKEKKPIETKTTTTITTTKAKRGRRPKREKVV